MEETILQIKFVNKKPVELNRFLHSLNALSEQYEYFFKQNYPFKYNKEESRLYLQKVEHGSIIIDLAGMVLPLIQDANTMMEFFFYMKNSLEFFQGKAEKKKEYSNNELVRFHSFLSPIAYEIGSEMHCSTKTGNITNNTYYISSSDSRVAQNYLDRIIESKNQEQLSTVYTKACFQWALTSFSQNKIGLDKIVIDNISPKPLKVLFLNESDKISATSNNLNFPNINWQDLIYVADVEVCRTGGHLRAYKIIKLYTEETFLAEDNDDENLLIKTSNS